ncbi:hypothetical protein ACIQYF_19530 [Pseudomonas sp. NPDC096917]|uniref:hypothetical protein n=1 Tax=Pseudomonas sp. NPDC096917 TaxID=3364483 RepID=UPI003839D5D7
MTIALYQLVIILTLVLTRYLTPKWLLPVGIIWTVVTVFTQFLPPVIVFQLAVIWGTFWLLKRSVAQTSAQQSAAGTAQPASRPAKAKPLPPPVLGREDIKYGEIFWRPDEPEDEPVKDLTTDLAHHEQEVSIATSQMLALQRQEQAHIESILERAEKHHQTALKLLEDEAFKHTYEEAYAMYHALLRGDKTSEPVPCTDFSRPTAHDIAPVDAAIQNTFEMTANEYSAFLKTTVVRLQQRKGLRELFEKEMHLAGGSHVLERIKNFEAGDEWRYADRRKKNRGTLADRQVKI